jgi:hypothetical protein
MALYRHFENTEALLDGVAELLWEEYDFGLELILTGLGRDVESKPRGCSPRKDREDWGAWSWSP